MISIIKITNSLGLHARASSKLVKLTNKFSSQINISKGNLVIDAKSILGILSLGASFGTEIEIETVGDDEEIAMMEIIDLFQNKFGEEK
ncbi:HPr family phosphocarrier protein [Desulfobacterota bacterium]|nr:HPr family phosphocarrier protein [Thermodesulfobacteriota bacterium]NSX00651.1 HPr family phosphocarrier protein [bacterium]|tara:strand:+ start:442 stop:708 length:267 start_codon:yes stop_codon:yes gene_type:complete